MDVLVDVPEAEDDGFYDTWDIGATPSEPSGPVRLDFSLEREIATLRALLERMSGIVAATDDPERLVLPLTRLVEAIARTLRAHVVVTGGPQNELEAAWARARAELELEEGR